MAGRAAYDRREPLQAGRHAKARANWFSPKRARLSAWERGIDYGRGSALGPGDPGCSNQRARSYHLDPHHQRRKTPVTATDLRLAAEQPLVLKQASALKHSSELKRCASSSFT